jgi:hypothetical protein
MSDWIVDRRPTEADADKNDQVLAWVLNNEYKDHPRWVFRHYTNVEVGQPWLPTPEPYKPPIDTSLAASIARYENLGPLTATYNECKDDRTRIIEAAKKWAARQATKEFANQPLPLDSDAPDPGEGWKLCLSHSGEQWLEHDGKWYNGQNSNASYHRRRVVMTTPPSNWFIAKRVWNLQADGWHDRCGAFMSGYARTHPVGWLAWCYRLDGETEPPQFALEWANNR